MLLHQERCDLSRIRVVEHAKAIGFLTPTQTRQHLLCLVCAEGGLEQATGDFSAPSVTRLQNGQFVVAFQLEDVDGDAHGIQVQRFSDSGVFAGSRVVANRTWQGDQTDPFLVRLSGAGVPFIVGWQSVEPDQAEGDVIFRVLKGE